MNPKNLLHFSQINRLHLIKGKLENQGCDLSCTGGCLSIFSVRHQIGTELWIDYFGEYGCSRESIMLLYSF